MRWHRLIALRVLVGIVGASAAVALPATARAGHGHRYGCHRCQPCYCCPQPAPPVQREAEEIRPRAAAPVVRAAVVPSMPMYTMPMMYAAMPVMPAMATQPTRAAEYRGATDCCARVDRLEEEMTKLAQSMRDLQTIVHGQTEVLKILANQQPGTPREAVPMPQPSLKPLQQ